MKIGEVARRTGVPPATLRAWERRYGVLRPERTEGGHRVYTAADVARVRQVLTLVESGVPLVAAAHRAAAGEDALAPTRGEGVVPILWECVDRLDERAFLGLLADAEATLAVRSLFDEVVAPLLRSLAKGPHIYPRNLAREHFTVTLVRSHLVRMLADHDDRRGPVALAASPAGEMHDLGALMAAVTLAAHGWHAIALGAHTPWKSIEALVAEVRPSCLLLGAELRAPATRLIAHWRPPHDCAVVLGGKGFRPEDAAGAPPAVYHGGLYADLPDVVEAAAQSVVAMTSPNGMGRAKR